ncbi:MAG TPA: hypothetical protein VMV72_19860 [Verrucomicrobiae bacterium]|nr:hypothetical protein [Verrucomicrobiae bacterium]
MKTNRFRGGFIGVLLVAVVIFAGQPAEALLATNTWSNLSGGKWEVASNWALGVPPNSTQIVSMTNGFSAGRIAKTNLVDATTVVSNSASMTVTNLILTAPLANNGTQNVQGQNILLLSNTGTTVLRVSDTLSLSTGTAIWITNSTMRVDGLGAFVAIYDDGEIMLNTGTFVSTNIIMEVGNFGVGMLTVSNGTALVGAIEMGENPGDVGTLTVAAGTNAFSGYLFDGYAGGSTGAIWVAGGRLVVTNSDLRVGNNGVGQMAVSNGTCLARDVEVGFVAGANGTLTVAGGTAALVGPLLVGGGSGTVWATGGQLVITNAPGAVGAGSGFLADGSIILTNGGSLVVSNSAVTIGNKGSGALTNAGGSLVVNGNIVLGGGGSTRGQMTMSGGMCAASEILLGNTSGSQGTLTMAGGTNTLSAGVIVGVSSGTSGTVWMTGGRLDASAGDIEVGNFGVGNMTMSNGTCLADGVILAQGTGPGTLTFAGGTTTIGFILDVAGDYGSTGTVWLTGGQLNVNVESEVGYLGDGHMTVSNGTWQTAAGQVGYYGAAGTLTVAGGTSSAYSSLTMGTPDCSGTGVITVVGGSLYVTNAAGNAVLDLENGTFTMVEGTVVVDTVVVTNACARFIRGGGTLLYNNAILDPNLDTDGDGIPNGYEQAHGLDPLDPTDAVKDNDGDGFSNLMEYQAGSDPNNFDSTPLRITSITRQTNDIVITWITAGNLTNVVEATAGASGGSYSNNFGSLSPVLVVHQGFVPTLVTTNYTDVGGATNKPSRYYRVRLIP